MDEDIIKVIQEWINKAIDLELYIDAKEITGALHALSRVKYEVEARAKESK